MSFRTAACGNARLASQATRLTFRFVRQSPHKFAPGRFFATFDCFVLPGDAHVNASRQPWRRPAPRAADSFAVESVGLPSRWRRWHVLRSPAAAGLDDDRRGPRRARLSPRDRQVRGAGSGVGAAADFRPDHQNPFQGRGRREGGRSAVHDRPASLPGRLGLGRREPRAGTRRAGPGARPSPAAKSCCPRMPSPAPTTIN